MIKENINDLITKAMKEIKSLYDSKKDTTIAEKRLSLLRILKGTFVNLETSENGKPVDDVQEIKIITKMIEDAKHNAKILKSRHQDELALDYFLEARILKEYLPKIPTYDEVLVEVRNVVERQYDSDYLIKMSDMKDIKPAVLNTLPYANGSDIAKAVKSLIIQ